MAATDEVGGGAVLVTLTMRHHDGQRLAALWAGLSEGWGAVIAGRGWLADRAAFGVTGWARAVEVTHGPAGWHLHVHALLTLDTPVSPETAEALGARMFSRWLPALGREGLTASVAHGVDARPVAMADTGGLVGYLSKAAQEVVGGMGKRGRGQNRTPFEILADGLATGNADDLDLWAEYESASHDRRQITWSRGLKEWAGVDELTDEEIVSRDEGGRDLFAITPATWPAARDHIEELLDLVETGDYEACRRWMRARGVDWTEPG